MQPQDSQVRGGGALPSYFPQLDALRALALGLVIMNHWLTFPFTGNWLVDVALGVSRMGWIGVDLFFVISGFLITGILLDTRDSPRYFQNFYARRALRIIPLYYLVLTLLIFVMPQVAAVRDLPNYDGPASAAWWHFAFLTNIAEGMGFSNSRVLVPFWSLAVEEHFYLLWPLVVHRFGGNLAKICAWGIVSSCLSRVVLLHVLGGNERVIGFLTPCRVDGLLAGSLIAVLARRGPAVIAQMVRWSRVLAPVGLAAIPTCLYLQEAQGRYHLYSSGQHPWVVSLGFLFFALFFSCVLILCVFGNAAARLATWRAANQFGKITYCAYLVHEPVHILVAGPLMVAGFVGAMVFSWQWMTVTAASFGITLAVSILSWRFFEGPILSLKRHFQTGRTMRSGGSEEDLSEPVSGFVSEVRPGQRANL
ncbi:MAG: acyltransferase family protein [Candidatus Sumerlaeaceae bacterium]